MGIYESKIETFNRDRTVLTITRDPGYGEIVVESWIKICEIRDRQNCFCCSCGDREGSDIACRNHGWMAKRPCETHDMPGSRWGEEMCDDIELHKLMTRGTAHRISCEYGKMPKSVEATTKEGN